MVKVPILQHLETLRDEELEERREKRRRQLAEEEEAKQNDRRTGGGEEAREQNLQGSGLGTVNSAAGETTAGTTTSCFEMPLFVILLLPDSSKFEALTCKQFCSSEFFSDNVLVISSVLFFCACL